MKQIAFEQKKLMANFLANIGVAWFASGVIGIFVNRITNKSDIYVSLVWGLGYSFIFLYWRILVIKSKKRTK